jgi:hypothetical protein
MSALALIIELAVGQSRQLTTSEGSWVTAEGVAGQGTGLGKPIALFVDPQNASGKASNANSGQTVNDPILTTTENNARIRATAGLGSDITITYMSEDLGSEGFSTETLNYFGHTLTVNMPLVDVFQGTTISGVTRINPQAASGGQRQRLQVADFTDWTPYVINAHSLPGTSAFFTRVLDLSADVSAWIMSQETGEVHFGDVSRPVNNAMTSSPQFTIGDSYVIVRPGRLPIDTPTVNSGSLIINNGLLHTVGLGPGSITSFTLNGFTANHCSIDGPLLFGGNFNDCTVTDGAQGLYIANLKAGGLLPNAGTDQQTGALNFSGDVYVTGDSAFTVGGTFYEGIFIETGALGVETATGIQIQDAGLGGAGIEPGFRAVGGGAQLILGLIWGNGNTDLGMELDPTGQLSLLTAPTPNITGATQDFGYVANSLQVLSGRAWDDSIGAYTALITCTWANFDKTIAGGGFGGNAHCVTTNAVIAR